MIYLSSFQLCDNKLNNGSTNIYPYNIFQHKYIEPFLFEPITVLYGDNGSGKSTLLNIIANKLELEGKEKCNGYGLYFEKFISKCQLTLGSDENGRTFRRVPENSRYIKSEDILYEIKKIQQETVLEEGYIYEHVRRGMTKEQAKNKLDTDAGGNRMEIMKFAQEKYSNGETAMQLIDDYLQPDGLYLLDEPEVSLSPSNQVKLSEEIKYMARLLSCQFIIATHSPFLLGTMDCKIYNLDSNEYEVKKWSQLKNIRYFYEFFQQHHDEF